MIESFTPIASSSEGCCYILAADDGSKILLDAGARFEDIQKAAHFKLHEFSGCLLSHAHGDHSKNVGRLLKAGVDVYASAETWEGLPGQHHRRRAVRAFQTAKAGPFEYMPFPAQHDSPGTLGFLVGHGGDRALYLTDSAYVKYRFEGLTHLFVEANHSTTIMKAKVKGGVIPLSQYERTARNHMSIERLMDMLVANDLSKVREIHLLHLSSAHSDEKKFRDMVRRISGCPVYVAARRAT